MSHIEIHVMSAAEIPRAVPLLAAQFQEHHIEISIESLHHSLAVLISERGQGLVLLATHAARTVGVAALSFLWTLDQNGRVAWLDELYVVPEMRCQGIGAALLRESTTLCRELGCVAIELEVDAERQRAENLYERHRFQRQTRRRFTKKLL